MMESMEATISVLRFSGSTDEASSMRSVISFHSWVAAMRAAAARAESWEHL